MTSRLARWANAPEQAPVWDATPVKGDLGIVVIPETQLFTQALMGSTALYASSMEGAYRGFFDANIQADWVLIDDIADYDLLYLPFPVMLTQATADRLSMWVRLGGTLVAEGCPGYFGDGGHVGTAQPNLGLDALFGAREAYVEFTPDLLTDLRVNVGGTLTWGGAFLQSYDPLGGRPVGWYDDGRIAAIDHASGAGRTRLIGTMCGHGYGAHPQSREPQLYADLLTWAGKAQHAVVSDPRVKARVHRGPHGDVLWVANPSRDSVPVRVLLSDRWGPYAGAQVHWGPRTSVNGREVALVVPARDVAVIRLLDGRPDQG
jgi:beta-galactosidase